MIAKRNGRPRQETTAQVVTTTEWNGTARPRPATLIGPKLLHDLVRNGYQVVGTCRACGSPLTAERSVLAGYGPVCAGRVSR